MKLRYFAYKRNDEDTTVLSPSELPPVVMKYKKKYRGVKAKLEAILRFSGVALSPTLSKNEVNTYINENFFGKKEWHKYNQVYNEVLDEREPSTENFKFLYAVEVVINNEKISPDDERLVHIITSELGGTSISDYKNLINPIVSYKKL